MWMLSCLNCLYMYKCKWDTERNCPQTGISRSNITWLYTVMYIVTPMPFKVICQRECTSVCLLALLSLLDGELVEQDMYRWPEWCNVSRVSRWTYGTSSKKMGDCRSVMKMTAYHIKMTAYHITGLPLKRCEYIWVI